MIWKRNCQNYLRKCRGLYEKLTNEAMALKIKLRNIQKVLIN
nr:MAG TPA: hypothetical protein [Caudoviricetes sp.]DAU58420.1 MAG TPA: hypothetical protein [Caudoviricetes sp.]